MFFFFKQKTAYEMRISDWSSDVCSSDLAKIIGEQVGTRYRGFEDARAFEAAEGEIMPPLPLALFAGGGEANGGIVEQRSEEHTSELQSLMRISYAVFCLKKNKQSQTLKRETQAKNSTTTKYITKT